MQLAAAGNRKAHAVLKRLDHERHIGKSLALQPLVELAGGDELAFKAGKRRIIGDKVHRHRRRIDHRGRQRNGVVGIGEGNPDGHVIHAGNGHDFADARRVGRHLLIAFKPVYLGDAGGHQACRRAGPQRCLY